MGDTESARWKGMAMQHDCPFYALMQVIGTTPIKDRLIIVLSFPVLTHSSLVLLIIKDTYIRTYTYSRPWHRNSWYIRGITVSSYAII